MRETPWFLTPRRFLRAIALGTGALGTAMLVALACGDEPIRLLLVLRGEGTATEREIFALVRLPRVLLAAGAGGLLGVSGAAFQSVLANPLADPYVLGSAGGAAFAVVLIESFAAFALGWSGRVACAILGAAVSLALVAAIVRDPLRAGVHVLVLAGVVVNAFFGAAIVLAVALLDPVGAHGAVLWMIGTLGVLPGKTEALFSLVALLGIVLLLASLSRAANALSMGEDGALLLGRRAMRVRWLLLAAGTIAAGIAVGVAGPIGFVGLIVPHCVRRLAGADHRLVFPLSAFVGAALIVLADIPARTIVSPQGLPVGVFTALLGVPFFLVLLRQSQLPPRRNG
ncbi:MAG TPA: iron ABC transporter permease [Planctomycetota bacterium]|nr:iron ABC transporter permease [Planctomycetota bacterium]